MEPIKSKENQLSGKLSAEESGDLSRFSEIFPWISENFREFSRILEDFPEFYRISENFGEFSRIFPEFPGFFQEKCEDLQFLGGIFLKEIASKSPPKPDFRRLRRQKMRKIAFLSTWKNDPKITFLTMEQGTPKNIRPPYARRVSL